MNIQKVTKLVITDDNGIDISGKLCAFKILQKSGELGGYIKVFGRYASSISTIYTIYGKEFCLLNSDCILEDVKIINIDDYFE